MSIFTVNEKKKMEYFAYTQDVTYQRLKVRLYREPLPRFICQGLLNEAMSSGFDIVSIEDGEKKHPQNNDITEEFMDQHYQAFETTAFFDRGYGRGAVAFYKGQFIDDVQQYIFRSYDPRQYEYGVDDWGQFAVFKPTDKFVRHQDQINMDTVVTRENFNPSNAYLCIIRETDTIGQGEPYILPIFDHLMTYNYIPESAMYYVVRIGAGLRVYYIPSGKANDEEYVSKIKNGIERWNAANSTILIEYDEDAPGPPPKAELLTAESIDFLAIRDLILSIISNFIKVPKSRLIGLEPGQLAAGEINQASYFDVLEQLQETYKKLLTWMLNKLAAARGWEIDWKKYDIVFRKRKALTDIEEAELTGKRTDNFTKLLAVNEKAGMEIEDLQTITKIEYETSDKLLAMFEKTKAAMQTFEDPDNKDPNKDEETSNTEDTEET